MTHDILITNTMTLKYFKLLDTWLNILILEIIGET